MAGQRHADVVRVPAVVGLSVETARRLAGEAGVVLAPPDADGPPLAALTWPDVWTIVSQSPGPGSELYRWDSVVVLCVKGDAGGGGAGVREPRFPLLPTDHDAAAVPLPE